MTKEIKLKFWDTNHKKALEPVSLDKLLRYLLFQSFPNAIGYQELKRNYENYIVLRYTGLKDKNGKEIYEGDIIEKYGDKEYKTLYVVEWYQKRCGFWLRIAKFDEEPRFDLNELREGLEIIGNIYENPELLKQSAD